MWDIAFTLFSPLWLQFFPFYLFLLNFSSSNLYNAYDSFMKSVALLEISTGASLMLSAVLTEPFFVYWWLLHIFAETWAPAASATSCWFSLISHSINDNDICTYSSNTKQACSYSNFIHPTLRMAGWSLFSSPFSIWMPSIRMELYNRVFLAT